MLRFLRGPGMKRKFCLRFFLAPPVLPKGEELNIIPPLGGQGAGRIRQLPY